MKDRTIRNYFGSNSSLLRVGFSLLLGAFSHSSFGQVSFPQLQSETRLSMFGTYTDVKPDYKFYGDYSVVGVTAGAFMQTPRVLGFEGRASIARWKGLEHEESALVGPRAALHLRRVSPYVCALGGLANGWRWQTPRYTGQPVPKLVEGLGPQWSVIGGVDVHLARRLVFRVGELSYSKVYLKNWGLTPLSASAGFVYRIR